MAKTIENIYFDGNYDYFQREVVKESLSLSERFNYIILLEKGFVRFQMLGVDFYSEKTCIIVVPSLIPIQELVFFQATYKIVCFDNSFKDKRNNVRILGEMHMLIDHDIQYFNPIYCLEKERINQFYSLFNMLRCLCQMMDKVDCGYCGDALIYGLFKMLNKDSNNQTTKRFNYDIKASIFRYVYLNQQLKNVFREFSQQYFISTQHTRNYYYEKRLVNRYFQSPKGE